VDTGGSFAETDAQVDKIVESLQGRPTIPIKGVIMPFPQQEPRTFTKAGIEWLAPNQRGCYGIFKAGLWVYVGKTGDLRARLLEHLAGDNPRITREYPTHFVTLLTANEVWHEKRLILELDPVANRQVG
jgi:hypothetical protein